MKSGLKKQWVDALRSGKYTQTQGQLRSGNSHCCLGVLCDIVEPDGWTGPNTHKNFEGYPDTTLLKKVGLLKREDLDPQEVISKWAMNRNKACKLAHMNDEGMTFGKIADWIERYV